MAHFYLNEDLIDNVRNALHELSKGIVDLEQEHIDGGVNYQQSDETYNVQAWLDEISRLAEEADDLVSRINHSP